MTIRRVFLVVTGTAGVAMFVQSLRMLGVDRMLDGVSRLGWGFGAIVVLSGAREVTRTLAWMRTIEGSVPLRFADAFRARLAGEALSALLPMGILVGEPTKAAQVGGRLPFATAFSALAVEFAFYCGSLALLIAAGASALVAAHQVPLSVVLLGAAAAALIAPYLRRALSHVSHADNTEDSGSPVADVMARAVVNLRRLRNLVSGFTSRHPEHLWPLASLEATFQLLAVVEVYVTLLLISPQRPTIASAVVLETVSRAITMTFKVLPMRLGVDEAGASLFAGRLHLGASTGVTLALIRKLRLLVWSAVGLLCFIRRSPAVSTRLVMRTREHNERPRATVDRHSVTALDGPGQLTSWASWTKLRCRLGRVVWPLGCLRGGMSRTSDRIAVIVLAVLLVSGSTAQAQPPASSVAGAVSVTGPDGQTFVLPGVMVILTCDSGAPKAEVSDEQGEFRFADVPVGSCSIVAELQGFKSGTKALDVSSGEATDVVLQLALDTLHEEVTVNSQMAVDDNPVAAHVERVTGNVMKAAPIANERFQDALPLIPGVVRGPDGLLNISGTRSNQSALMFNSADGTDPVTGEDAIELPLDAVSSVQVRGTAFAPEFGQSTGAVTTVETQRAGDIWHLQVNDLEPRVRRRGGKFVGIESFTPRVTLGGPLVKGKLSVLESVQYEFTRDRVFSLPPFESDTQLESLESFSRADWTASPTNHFTGSALVSPRKTTYAGLNTFNPQGVTPDIKNHNILGSATDQIVIGDRGVFETRVSVKQFDSTIDPSQGHGPMRLGPEVNSGSYFNDQDRTSRRVEWLNTYAFTPLGPAHLLKIGAGVTSETFRGTNVSRPVDIVRKNGTLSQEITFVGDGTLHRSKTALQGYAEDSWTANARLTVQYGARYDHDSITGDINIAPRGSFTATLSADGRTVVRGGAGLFYDPIPLNAASFDQMQERTLTAYNADGAAPIGLPVRVRNVVPSVIHTPRSINWDLEIDREWIKNLFVRVGYQQRDNRFESVVNPTTLEDGEQVLQLRSDGRSRYRQGQVTTRYEFHGTDQILGSYTRSSAIGNLNDFNTYFGNVENPIVRPDERAALPWDAPNRYLFWANISLPHEFTVFPLLDVRTGFPLSAIDEDRNFVGPRNSGRYPTFVSLDGQVSKRIRVFHHNATIGLKVFNITNHFNPRDYQGNLASADVGGFFNSVGRTFRGRWIFEF